MKLVSAVLALLAAGCMSSVNVHRGELQPAVLLEARTIHVVASQYFTADRQTITDAQLTERLERALGREFPKAKFVGEQDKADVTVLFLLTDKLDCDECDRSTRYWNWLGEVSRSDGTKTISLSLRGETHKLQRHPEEVFATRLRELAGP